jgi:hypothetical protein
MIWIFLAILCAGFTGIIMGMWAGNSNVKMDLLNRLVIVIANNSNLLPDHCRYIVFSRDSLYSKEILTNLVNRLEEVMRLKELAKDVEKGKLLLKEKKK